MWKDICKWQHHKDMLSNNKLMVIFPPTRQPSLAANLCRLHCSWDNWIRQSTASHSAMMWRSVAVLVVVCSYTLGKSISILTYYCLVLCLSLCYYHFLSSNFHQLSIVWSWSDNKNITTLYRKILFRTKTFKWWYFDRGADLKQVALRNKKSHELIWVVYF